MKRPYYVYTPRNIYGEDLACSRHNNVQYEIKATHTGTKVYAAGKSPKLLEEQVKKLNDDHETMLAYAMHI